MRTMRKRYSAESKREALKRASEEGMTGAQVSEELGVSTRQLRRWRDQLRLHGDNAFPGHGKNRDQDLSQLRLQVGSTAGACFSW